MEQNESRGKPTFSKAYCFGLVTAALFLLSWVGQFVTQLITVRNENEAHGEPFEGGDFMAQFLASTFENWQSEFLQLVWQAAGLTLLLFWARHSRARATSGSRPSSTGCSESAGSTRPA